MGDWFVILFLLFFGGLMRMLIPICTDYYFFKTEEIVSLSGVGNSGSDYFFRQFF
jgi:hypothetical protein